VGIGAQGMRDVMKRSIHLSRFLLAALAACLVLPATAAMADDVRVGAIVIRDPWARASPSPMMQAGAAYAQLENTGSRPDRLIAAASPAAERVELHTHIKDGDIMRMRRVEAIEVPPGERTVLQPGGLHVMLMGLRQPLRAGETVPLTLVFEEAGSVELAVPVAAAGMRMPPHGKH
jgi:periplasmic copper chaperone A